jgi:undecaprenyl-diphosphatase
MDFYLFQLINQFAFKWEALDVIGLFFAEYSGYVLIAVLFGSLFFGDKRKNLIIAVEAIFSAVLSRFVVTIIRLIYYRPRPFVAHQVNLLSSQEAGASFPSGHAAFFFALSFIVYFYNKKAGTVFLIVSFLMGIARIFIGVHYPSDILGGIFVGFISAWLVYKYLGKFIASKIPQSA